MADYIRKMDVGVGINANWGEINKLQDNLAKIKRSMSDIGKAKFNDDATKRATQNAESHAKAVDQEAKATDKNAKSADDLSKSQSRVSAETGRVGAQATNSSRGFDKLTAAQNRAVIAGKKIDTINKGLQKVANATRAVSLGVGAAAAYGIKKSMDLQDIEKRTTALLVTGGEKRAEAQKNVNQMQIDGAKYSKMYGKSQTELADGYQELVKRGYDSNQALGAQKSLLQASIASGDSYSDVVHGATTALESFGMRTQSTSGMLANTKTVVNQLAYSADMTATDFHGISKAMEYVGTAAHQSGFSLHETAAAIGELSNYGLEADKAGTGLRKMIVSLQSPGKTAADQLSALGLRTKNFVAQNGKMKTIAQIMGILHDKTKDMGQAEKGTVFHNLFGTTGQQAGQILSQSTESLKKLDKEVENSQKKNYVQNLATKNMGTTKAEWNKLKQSVTAVAMTFGKVLLPPLTQVMNGLAHMADDISNMPKMAQNFVAFGTMAVAGIYPVTKALQALLATAKTVNNIHANGLVGAVQNSVTGTNGHITGLAKRRATKSIAEDVVANTTGSVAGSTAEKVVTGSGAQVAEKAGGSVLSKVFGKAIPGLNLLLAATPLLTATKKTAGRQIGKAVGGMGGVAGGTAAGAALGSVIPGPGTAIGAVLGAAGGALGGLAGDKLGGKVGADFQKGFNAKTKKGFKIPVAIKGGAKKVFSDLGKGFDVAKNSIVKSAKWLGNSVTKAFKPLGKTASNSWGSIKNSADKAFKPLGKQFAGVGKAYSQMSKSIRNSAAFKSVTGFINKSFIPTLQKVGSWMGKVAKYLWNTEIKKAVSSLQIAFKGITSVAKWALGSLGGIISGSLQTVKGIFETFDGIFSGKWTKMWTGVKDVFSGIFNTIFAPFKNALKGVTNAVSNAWDSLRGKGQGKDSKKSKGHAKGGRITASETALVGEEGFEFVTNKQHGNRLVGTNGPELTKLHAGDNVFNHRDSLKLAHGGLGKGKTIPGFAKGNASLGKSSNKAKAQVSEIRVKTPSGGLNATEKSTKKSMSTISSTIVTGYSKSTKSSQKSINGFSRASNKTWNSVAKQTKSSADKIQKNSMVNYNGLTKHAVSSIKQLGSKNASQWKNIYSDSNHYTGLLKKSAIADFDNTQKGVYAQIIQMRKQVSDQLNAMTNNFQKQMNLLPKYAHSAMSDAINQLNKGFSSINGVLGQFGGGGSVLKLAHYAKGTQGVAKHDHMAVVNDAKWGPKQEAIVHADGSFDLPRGTNKIVPIRKGDAVMTGQDTQTAQNRGILPRYAKGKDSKSTLKSLINNDNSNPSKAFNRDFTAKIDSNALGSSLSKGLQSVNKGASIKVGNPWNAEVWSQMSDAMSGGGSAAGGNWLNNPGMPQTDGFGSSRASMYGKGAVHDGADYSAGIGSAIRAIHGGKVYKVGGTGIADLGKVIEVKSDDGFREIYQEFGDMNNIKVAVGDIIKTGQTIATLGHLVGAGSGSHVHIGVAKSEPLSKNMLSTAGWYDPSKMHGNSDGSSKLKHKKSKNPALTKLVKSQIASQLKWVGKNLADDEDAGGSMGNPGGAGVGRWKSSVIKALKANHFAATDSQVQAWMRVIARESNGNPRAINNWDSNAKAGHPSKGLVQTIGPTFESNKFPGHGNIYNGYDNLLAGIHYAAKAYGRGAGMFARVSGPLGYANGGWSERPKIFGEVPGQPEVVINPKRDSADRLISEAITARNKATGRKPKAQAVKGNAKVATKASAPTINITINANGSNNAKEIAKLAKQAVKEGWDELNDKYAEQQGYNDEGGFII